MNTILDIITVTKDDLEGVTATVRSSRRLRDGGEIRQIIVDSSNEDTSEEIRRLLVGEQNIDYIWQEPLGISAAFNLGLTLTKGEWIWFLNGRDEAHPSMDCEKLLYIVKETNADAIIFEMELMQSRLRFSHPPIWKLWPALCPNWIPHAATIVRRQLFNQYGLFSEKYKIAMDGELWLRLFSNRVVVDTISIPIALFDESGLANTQRRDKVKEVRRLIKSHFWTLLKYYLGAAKFIYNVLRYCHIR